MWLIVGALVGIPTVVYWIATIYGYIPVGYTLKIIPTLIVFVGVHLRTRYPVRNLATKTDRAIMLYGEISIWIGCIALWLFGLNMLHGWIVTGRVPDASVGVPLHDISFRRHPLRLSFLVFVFCSGVFMITGGLPLMIGKFFRDVRRGEWPKQWSDAYSQIRNYPNKAVLSASVLLFFLTGTALIYLPLLAALWANRFWPPDAFDEPPGQLLRMLALMPIVICGAGLLLWGYWRRHRSMSKPLSIAR
jgi:hypothetical protein